MAKDNGDSSCPLATTTALCSPVKKPKMLNKACRKRQVSYSYPSPLAFDSNEFIYS